MNKRFVELAYSAKLYDSYVYNFEFGNKLDYEHQKFAESIVRECAGIVETESDLGTKHTIDQILKHFGVEE